MLTFIKGLLPSKVTIAIILALLVACGYLFLTKQTADANLKVATTELVQAKADIALQKTTITGLQGDISKQATLTDQFNTTVNGIREQTQIEIDNLDSMDFTPAENSTAADMEKQINDQQQAIIDSLNAASRGAQ